MKEQYLEVLKFWFGEDLKRAWPATNRSQLWFYSTPETDELIRSKFGMLVEDALTGQLISWENEILGKLALIILLDQFTRNIFRGTERAYSGDNYAKRLATEIVDQELDKELTVVSRVFLYLPFEHSENLTDQDKSVFLYTELYDTAHERLKPIVEISLKSAIKHRETIKEYGRFPYRNLPLGRVSTPEEQLFLDKKQFFF